MRCEVVAIGTELLLGQIVDTNSSWIGEQLALAGIDCLFQSKVGDNLGRIVQAFELALSRADAVIACGGLGPTHDDITRDALAKLMGVGLRQDPAVADRIREMFASRGRTMPDNNLRQAEVPLGAALIPQMPGTAPGLICPIGAKVIFAVPGIPSEMKAMMNGTIISDLRRRSGATFAIKSRTLRTWGQAESRLAEMLAGRIAALDAAGNPTIAFLASGIEGIKVRITAKASDDRAALEMIEREEALVRDILGALVFGIDDETMELCVLRQMRRRNLTLAAAESVTGGLLAARLSATTGGAESFRGSIVCANDEAAKVLLGLQSDATASETSAQAAASASRRWFGSDIGISAVAAPLQKGSALANTVFLGLDISGATFASSVKLPGDAERQRQFAVIGLLDFLRQHLASLDASASNPA
jgi:nicotinamide-nucleotide amidase